MRAARRSSSAREVRTTLVEGNSMAGDLAELRQTLAPSPSPATHAIRQDGLCSAYAGCSYRLGTMEI